jgi:hypothetical protein
VGAAGLAVRARFLERRDETEVGWLVVGIALDQAQEEEKGEGSPPELVHVIHASSSGLRTCEARRRRGTSLPRGVLMPYARASEAAFGNGAGSDPISCICER